MSEDVDLFTDRWDPDSFRQAVASALDAYRLAGLEVTVFQQAETFARLRVLDPSTQREGSVDLAADGRNHEPDLLAIGPVLAEPDAVGNKVAAVFSRGYARDYLDLAGILASGRHSREDLIARAAEVDGGFKPAIFAEALAGVDRFPDDEYARYGADSQNHGRSLGTAAPRVGPPGPGQGKGRRCDFHPPVRTTVRTIQAGGG